MAAPAGGDALDAFKAEVGRLCINEQLLAELAVEYGRYRGLLSAQEADVLEARAAGGSGGACEPSTTAAPAATTATGQTQPLKPHALQPQQQRPQRLPPSAQQQQQQQERAVGEASGQRWSGSGADPRPGPLGLARGDASWAGRSPPNKVARRSPPGDEATEGAEGGCVGGGKAAGGQQHTGADRRGGGAPGQPSSAWASAPSSASEGAEGGAGEAGPDGAASGEVSQGADSGCGSGSGSGSAVSQQKRGQGVLSELLRLGQVR